ncbi:MAG: nucleotidyltransferase domain-containing protein [Acidobacteriota bacterium]
MKGKIQIDIPREKIEELCRRHRIQKFSVFGSVLRDDFRPDSDVDVLVEFDPNAKLSLFDLVHIEEELAALLDRKVDLVEAETIRNPFRRAEIMRTHEVIFAA